LSAIYEASGPDNIPPDLENQIGRYAIPSEEGAMLHVGSLVQVGVRYNDLALVGLKGCVRDVRTDRACPYTVYLYALDLELRFTERQLQVCQEAALVVGNSLYKQVIYSSDTEV
jgi:hypothetical protein